MPAVATGWIVLAISPGRWHILPCKLSIRKTQTLYAKNLGVSCWALLFNPSKFNNNMDKIMCKTTILSVGGRSDYGMSYNKELASETEGHKLNTAPTIKNENAQLFAAFNINCH